MESKPRIDYIRVKLIPDECPDQSYLESKLSEDGKILISSMRYSQKDLDESPKEIKRYIKEDMARLAKFNSGELCAYGCMAEAEVSYPLNDQGDRRTEKFTSGGLWGLESDSGKSYFKEVAEGQLEDLRCHLNRFNIEPIRRRWVNGDYWEDIKKEAINRMGNYETRKNSIDSQWVKVED